MTEGKTKRKREKGNRFKPTEGKEIWTEKEKKKHNVEEQKIKTKKKWRINEKIVRQEKSKK